MKTYFFAIFILFSMVGTAQQSKLEISQLGLFNPENSGTARIYFNQDILLKDLMISKAQVKKESTVWRVQVYQGSGKEARAEATSIKNNFKSKYPDVSADWLYHSPYFKVHVGNFKTRLEAESFKKKIQGEYKSLWVVSQVNEIN